MAVRRALVVTLWLAMTSSAAAQAESAWSVVEGCPAPDEARSRADLALVEAMPATLDVTIARTQGLFRAGWVLRGSVAATSELEDADCDALVDAVIVLAALALGLSPASIAPPESLPPASPSAPTEATNEALTESNDTESSAADSSAADSSANGSNAADSNASDTSATVPRGRVGRGPRLAWIGAIDARLETTLASPPVGIALELGVAYDALRALVGFWAFPSMDADGARSGQSASFYALGASIRAGPSFAVLDDDRARVELGALGRLDLGVLHGAGAGVALPRAGDALVALAGLDACVTYLALGAVGVTASVGLSVPLAPTPFELDGAVVHRPDPAGLRLAIGVAGAIDGG
ncbi:MAG: hypothetical protein AB7S26_29735 [Sandaracinaceae bacterium]